MERTPGWVIKVIKYKELLICRVGWWTRCTTFDIDSDPPSFFFLMQFHEFFFNFFVFFAYTYFYIHQPKDRGGRGSKPILGGWAQAGPCRNCSFPLPPHPPPTDPNDVPVYMFAILSSNYLKVYPVICVQLCMKLLLVDTLMTQKCVVALTYRPCVYCCL